ncbi:MAG: hypothetical protein LBG06_12535 [Deltaproteobacteria bacterium]|jgi:3-deoxy-D-manno-octulosonic-acid transferase|nr:hypothetical protein [Deltaproteobacteria bacterium]
MRHFYAVLYTTLFIVSAPVWAARCLFSPAFLRHLKARLLGPGRILPALHGRKRVWIWALSLGEVLSAREMARRLAASGTEVVVTATTLSGIAMARQLFPDLTVLPTPLDFRLSVRRFLDCVRPDCLVLIETDAWPGVLLELSARGLPAYFAGARLSPGSFRNYRLARFFWKKVLALFAGIAVQSEEDLAMFLELGADPARIRATGNLKFDEPPPDRSPGDRARLLAEAGWPEGRWLVGGSIHPGEDFLLLELFSALSRERPDLRLLIAPRDRHRFGAFRKHAREFFPGRTACRSVPSPGDKDALVFVLDTLGELRRFYLLGECALVGKSWPGRHEGGGHNPLEPALLGIPVISGPRIHNFKWMYRALCDEGGAVIADRKSLPTVLAALLDSPGRLRDMGVRAREFVLSHRGAVERTLAFLSPPGWKDPVREGPGAPGGGTGADAPGPGGGAADGGTGTGTPGAGGGGGEEGEAAGGSAAVGGAGGTSGERAPSTGTGAAP